MNAQRRKDLLELAGKAQAVLDALEMIRDDEQEYLDNMPEGIKDGDKGDRAQEVIDYLDGAVDGLHEAIGGIESAAE